MDQITNIDAIEEIDVVEAIEETESSEEIGEQVVQVELTIEQIVDQLIDASKKTEFTMYAIHVILNSTLETIDATKDGDAYRVRPQMVYNYNRNKMVVPKQQVTVATIAQVRAFVIKFATKFAK